MKDGTTLIDELKDRVHDQHDEIKRLNNIIDKLEMILEKEREIVRPSDDYNYGVENTLDYLWYKLQELKGENNE